MKILQISPYTTCNDVPLLSQCKSGFGYMTYDIAQALSKEAKVDELLYNYRYKEFKQGGIRFIASTLELYLKNIFKCSNPFMPLKLWWEYRMQLRTFVRLVYLWLISGYYYDVIKKGNYDIVHIHGCNIYDEVLMDVCRRANQKFVVTLHGLDSFSDSVVLEPAGKQYERNFLQRVTVGEFPITVISTGIKRILEKTYNIHDIPNLFVVCNAFSFSEQNNENIFDIKDYYGLDKNAKIILYIGNLCHRKNQKQIIDAFKLLSKELQSSTYVLFLGRDIESDYNLNGYIRASDWSKNFILCGNVDKEKVHYYYEQGDAVALLSISEGFGLSLIEGMHFGKPCITFTDLDAFEDIYNEVAVVGLEERSDECVAEGIKQCINSQWDNNAIKAYSQKFESNKMATNYIDVYKKVLTLQY